MNTQHCLTRASQNGFTLIELMITIGIIGVLSAVAIPAYDGYVKVSKMSVALNNAEGLAGFQRTYFYEYNTFKDGIYDPSTTTDTLTSALEWNPKSDKDQFRYVAATGACGDIINCVDITVSYLADTSISQTVTLSP